MAAERVKAVPRKAVMLSEADAVLILRLLLPVLSYRDTPHEDTPAAQELYNRIGKTWAL